MNLGKFSLAALSVLIVLLMACGNENTPEPESEDMDPALEFDFTLPEGETAYSMKIDGTLTEGYVEILNSLEIDKSISLNLWNGNDFDFASISWLPISEGIFTTGYDLGVGNGTQGNRLYMVAKVKKDDKHHYAYSSHAYGFLEDELIPDSYCKVRVRKLDGAYVTYDLLGWRLTSFIGEVEGQFAGTFISEEGNQVEVTEGQFRVVNELPAGAEVVD